MANVARVLVVTAHPDDAEWYAGGSIARLAREGSTVTYIICTEGEKGSYDPGTDPQALAARRKQEQKAACELLGVGQAIFLGHADGGLENSPALRRQLTALYRRERPDLLITFDPWKRYELHPDHLVAVFQEGEYPDQGALATDYATSLNAGLSWTQGVLPGLTAGVTYTFTVAASTGALTPSISRPPFTVEASMGTLRGS